MDGIGHNVLKHCAMALYQPLCHLFQASLRVCKLPDEWKIHSITPIFKDGDKSSVRNYRPISLLSSVSKVMERLVYNHLMEFLANSISTFQYGFLKNHSCVQQLLLFYHELISGPNSPAERDIVFLDFSKAFDSVPHKELLLKLKRLGVSGNIWLWLQDYLHRRFQYVNVRNSRSELLPVKSGVPQGSILGPLLFLIYVNDLPEVVKHVIFYMFADDVKCAMPIRSPLDSLYLQEDLEALCDWSAKWKLKFKESKCVLLRCFTNNNSTPTPTVYTLNGKEIQASNFHKDLGIVISDNLSFRCRYELLIARAYRILGLLRRTFNHRPCVKEKMALYISLVRSQLMYCSQVWRPYLLRDIDKIERVQRRATKYILNDFTSDYKSRLITLGILPLMYVFELNDLMLCQKSEVSL